MYQHHHQYQSAPASLPSLGRIPRRIPSENHNLNQNLNPAASIGSESESLGFMPITQPDAVTPPSVPVPPNYTSAQQPQADTNNSTGMNANLQQFSKNPNGAGMWKSWRKSFNTPLLALLDLFDNAIDASLNVFEHGRRRRPLISAQTDDYEQSGLVLRNSCVRHIPPLEQVLQVYTSYKSNSDSIGENGVGVKQASASLSDLTFFMTRNGDVLELGFLMASLQQEGEGLVAPEHTFEVGVDLEDQLQQLAQDYPTVYGEAFRVYGDGDVALGMDHLLRHFKELTTGQNWKLFDHVFCVLMPRLRHGAGSQKIGEAELLDLTENDGDSYKIRTTRMLSDLAEKLPSTYIHCQEFDIYIQKKKIDFHYWEKRLAELTEFTIKVDPQNIWHSSAYWKGADWSEPELERADTMRVFCGFDPERASGNKSSAVSLYVHSRASGRLIKYVGDARGELGLVNGSTDMCQGLTILLDDYEGTLPLNPQKQDISFSLEVHGEVKKDNLYAWLAGVTHFYWNMQMDLFGLKSAISKAVTNCAEALSDDDNVNLNNVRSFGNGNFTRYEDVVWRNLNGNIRCGKEKRRKSRKVMGRDTLVSLKAPDTPYNEKKPASKKRKANAMDAVRQEHEMMTSQKHYQSEIDRLKQQVLEGEASGAQLRQITDMQEKKIGKILQIKETQEEQIEDLTAQSEEHAAAELVWRRKKQLLKQELRESKKRVEALESESPQAKVKTLRRQLKMAQDDCKMKEDLSMQAKTQIQLLENVVSSLKAERNILESSMQQRSSNIYDDQMNELEEI